MWDAAGNMVGTGRRGGFRPAVSAYEAAIARRPDAFITLRWWPVRLIYDSAKIGWKIACSPAPAT
jgi:hypothetical protein